MSESQRTQRTQPPRPLLVVAVIVTLASACDKPPPPPPPSATTAAPPVASAPPTTAASTVMCFGAICAKGELCFDASHARDASAPYECFRVPEACGAKPSCDCLLSNHDFDCAAPNRLLCSESATGEPQVVCVMIFE